MFTATELGALMLVVGAAFYVRKIFVKITPVLWFLGMVMLGTSGWIGRLLVGGTGFVEREGGRLAQGIVGAASVFAVGTFLYLAIHFIHDLHPRFGRPSRTTAWYGLVLGAIIVGGATGVAALAGLHQGIVSAITGL